MNTKHRIEEKVFSYLEEHHMLNPNDRVVAGISGGADSVCLLFVLLEYRKKVPFSLAVVHVNHGIRQEAQEDARYVEELCQTEGIPFYGTEIDVRQKAKKEKCSEEEAGRKARYEAFAKVAEEFDARKIAVAHNCNDRSETMLFHLFRGSSIKGLGSIRPVRDNIIRPILCLERREVEEYLSERNIAFCRDVTNDEDDYTRNRIRHHILPYVEKEIVSGCVGHMAQTADMLADTEDYLEKQTKVAMKACVQIPSLQQAEVQINLFLTYHKIIRQRILYEVITALAESKKDISGVHVRDLMTLFTESGNRMICLPYGLIARRQYDKVLVEIRADADRATLQEKKNIDSEGEKEIDLNLKNLPTEVILPDGSRLLFTLLPEETDSQDFPLNQYTKWFDYDKIEKSLVLRERCTGDYLTIAGKEGGASHKPIKDYMIAEKIPRQERDRIPLLATGSHVIWLIGYRISEYYKVNRNTKRILQVQLIGKGNDSYETEEKNGGTCKSTTDRRRGR
uniref:tRNA lysidine(34) synthetase TilS n=1 Tax=Acetatifactor sp. TaxID=1872090 RepID=UPI00405748AD